MSAPLFLDKFDMFRAQSPNQLAVIDLAASSPIQLTYAQVDELSTRAAIGLLQRGVQPGDAVAYQLPSGWPFIVITLGLWKLGAVPCPLLPSLREREVTFIMQSSGSRLLIVPDEFRRFTYAQLVDRIRPELPALEHVIVIDHLQYDPAATDLGGIVWQGEMPDDMLADVARGARQRRPTRNCSTRPGQPASPRASCTRIRACQTLCSHTRRHWG
ncbi:hypothetical protein GCM10025858_11570 [Alicyclobacillus sacchari]|uniref:AMP-binding protein n=1 Tax=Alicyclobacillus sacchari TaxID=392010 RepID=UPI0023E97146|nr:AMP-binding protein [Alicyclobacillus sacchari]GMA56654.1 hypothetical protein GCM10025858_11570 [Alicyclobacillus sacchari]